MVGLARAVNIHTYKLNICYLYVISDEVIDAVVGLRSRNLHFWPGK